MDSWPVHVELSVRERDCWGPGIIDESALLVFFREARRAYIGKLNAQDESYRYRLWDARLKVRKNIEIDQELVVAARCDELGDKAFRIRYRIRDRGEDELLVEGSSVQVLVDDDGTDRDIPELFRQRVIAIEGRHFPRPS